ncbi:MAG TPA: nitronate monooxygenase [Thermoanaerobaculia bacterium]|nr:nitronate monooxygenase [Thermoanaerobaculia bacterium]
MKTALTEALGIEVPLICGAMYPCSNPELVAAVSEAGGIGVVQPLSLVYVHKREFRAGMREIRALTQKPVGLNVLTEKSMGSVYAKRMSDYVDVALEEGVRFFVTALGNPRWVVDRVKSAGGVVYHDVIDRRWAEKAAAEGVDGLICVNRRAGGHLGKKSPEELYAEIADLKLPLVCAGGVGSPKEFRAMLDLGYAGVQCGTRFIAATECTAHADYKNAILEADEEDIVPTERVTGVPLAVINTPFIERMGTKAGPIGRLMLKGRTTKHWIRAWYTLTSFYRLKGASMKGATSADCWQAGKSVATISSVQPAGEIVRSFAAALD